jgi:protein O-mannosyl-transferase
MTYSIAHKLKLIIFLFAIVLFGNTLSHDFAWDDSIVITENPRVQKGIKGIPDLFIKYNSDYKADKYGYRPIVLSSFAFEYSVFNKSAHAMHLMNVLYFALLCLVIFNVLQKLFYKYSVLFPFAITLLFAAHPLHCEVVANIKSRDEIFAMLFAFLSIGQLISYVDTKKIKHLIYVALLFILAFLSKESAIVFLLIIPLTLLYKANWSNLKSIVKPILISVPLLIICFVIVKLSTTSKMGVEASKGAGIYFESGILGNSFFYTDALSTKLANALTILMVYVKNFLLPNRLLYFYGYNQIPVANWGQILVIFSLIFHLSLLVIAIVYRKKQKEICYGILFYFSAIFIHTHIIRTLADTMADRFMFVPSLGLLIASVFALSKLFKINSESNTAKITLSLKQSTSSNEKNFKYLLLLICFTLSITTFYRNKVWKNNETLISHDMPYLENCARAHNYYADILKTKLAAGFNANIEKEMISHYQKSIAISTESYYSYLGLATYFINTKKFNESISVLNEMLKKYSNQADPNFYIGQAYYSNQRYKEAVTYLQKSLDLAPEVSNTYYYLSLALSKQNQFDKAISIINTCKQKFGETAFVYEAMGNIYFDKGDIEASTKNTFEMLNYGANAESVYKTIIGRYQVKKMDAEASFYYKQGLEKGVFRK